MKLDQYWVLTDVRGPLASKSHSTGDFWVIEMTNAETQERLITYATEGLENFSNWSGCVNKQWGVYTNISRHQKKEHLINGDCIPQLVETMTPQQARSFRATGSV